MTKKVVYFGGSQMDAMVMAHLTEAGIDPAIVYGYTLERANDGTSTLTLKIHFNDKPAAAEKEG